MSGSFSRQNGWLNRLTAPHIITLVILSSIHALNMNILLPSLKGMELFFQTEYRLVQLTISGYLACTAVLQLFVGPLSDRFGRRPVLLWSLVLFLVATVGCIFAPTIEILLFFRMVQAVVATGMVLARAIIRDMFDADEAASKIGYVVMGMAVVPMIGPVLGGFLEELFGWQAIFVLVLVFGLLATLLIWADLGETNMHKSASFRAQFNTYPELLRSRRFWGYSFSSAFGAGVFFAFIGSASFVAEDILGLTPSELGVYFMFIPAGYMFGNFLTGRFSKRVGLDLMIVIGCAITTIAVIGGLVFFYFGFGHPAALFGVLSLTGIGNGLVLPNASAGMVSVRPHLAGSASGLGGTIMIGGGAILSGLSGSVSTIETGAFPLFYMMLATSILSLFSSVYTIRIVRQTTV